MAKMQATQKLQIMETVYEKLLSDVYKNDPQKARELARSWIKKGI